jgi:hypothetical protein
MPDSDSRRSALRAFDAFALAFAQDASARVERGASLAAGDVERLAALAERLAADIETWGHAIETLDVGRDQPFRPEQAGRLLIESVFDDALTPPACRVLRAAFDLAASAP